MSGITKKLMRVSGKPLEVGDFYEGGFYAGNIFQGGVEYELIVAPRATGESTFTQYKTGASVSPVATVTLNNGPAATAAMVAAGGHPAAAFCDALTINGFSDWYLPARDELEIAYRNLKPSTMSNSIAVRTLSPRTYPEGNDVSGDTDGRNRNSSPLGAAYIAGNPAQTAVVLFQTGGSESFESNIYWTSTEFNNTEAWVQEFSQGIQNSQVKNPSSFGPQARAFRRVPA